MSKIIFFLFLNFCFFLNKGNTQSLEDSLLIVYTDESIPKLERIMVAKKLAQPMRHKPSAQPFYTKALGWAKEIGNELEEAELLWQLGIVYYNQSSFDTSTLYYTQALLKYNNLEKNNERATILRNLGKNDSKQGLWPEAIKKYHRALKIEEELENESGKAVVLNLIGSIHRKQKNFDDALDFLNRSYNIALSANNIPTQIDALGNIATTYQELDSVELAAEYFEKTLNLSRANGLERRVAVCVMTLGQIHQLAGRYAQAKPYLQATPICKHN